MRPLDVLEAAVASFVPYLQESGELFDPVVGAPFQYGTPYFAYSNAVLALKGGRQPRSVYADRAYRGLAAALAHVANPAQPATYAHVDPVTGTLYRGCHRDFFWPAILRTYAILQSQGLCDLSALTETLAAVEPEASFNSRPPSNWAAVWLSGEWLRIQAGLSSYSREQFEKHLAKFFESYILLEQGFYQEPGHPNSYDLFTRYHLACILCAGYDGRMRKDLERLMETGLQRSLAVQLSDGSLASAYRSTGQTWTLGVQCAYFAMASAYFRSTHPDLQKAAEDAAVRALASFMRWRRVGGPYSPVENVLPLGFRVGYEFYTSDANYGALAIGFLAHALELGLETFSLEIDAERPPTRLIEHDPVHRAIVHNGEYSVHVNALPSGNYDAFGVVDLTFGMGRYFHLATPVRHVQSGRIFGIGMALRREPGPGELTVLSQEQFALIDGIQKGSNGSTLRVTARPKGKPYMYLLEVGAAPDGVRIHESTPGFRGPKTLLIPYLRDAGTGNLTDVEMRQGEILFRHENETVAVALGGAVERFIHLPHGYESRRGLCGLVRIDFREAGEGINYIIARRT